MGCLLSFFKQLNGKNGWIYFKAKTVEFN